MIGPAIICLKENRIIYPQRSWLTNVVIMSPVKKITYYLVQFVLCNHWAMQMLEATNSGRESLLDIESD